MVEVITVKNDCELAVDIEMQEKMTKWPGFDDLISL